MKRLFVKENLKDKATVIITGQDAHHLIFATRVRPGEKFVVVDGSHQAYDCEVSACTKEQVEMKILAILPEGNTEAPVEVILAQALLKNDKMDFIVQKAVELGMAQVVPVLSKNCVVKYDDKKKANRLAKWQKIMEEAAKQCGRSLIPTVDNFRSLQDLAEEYKDYCKIMCYEAEDMLGLKTVLQNNKPEKILILIGPEGGFTPEEYTLCRERGFHTISLGKRILRAETAALAAMSIVMYEAGDLGSLA